MRYLLDTDTCIFLIKGSHRKASSRFQRLGVGDVGISAITYCELAFGVAHSSDPVRNERSLNKFLGPLEVVDFPASAATDFGRIKAHLKGKGTPIGSYDLLIAAHAIASDLTLVTNNVKEFCRVPGLKVENWV